MYTILFIDDEKNVLNFFKDLLSEEYEVLTCNNGFKSLKIIEKKTPDIIFIDVMMPDIDGIETLKIIKDRFKDALIIMLTAVTSPEKIVEAMKLGAYDYICKPFEIKDIRAVIKKTINFLDLKMHNKYYKENVLFDSNKIDFIGENKKIIEIKNLVKKIADKDVTILIQGETGTGKEIIAKLIHHYSHRNKNDFVSIDCSAIPFNLLESELFGYEKGAFTNAMNKKIGRFELADKGTLFLDEIGNIPMEFQTKLLRAIQEREIVRLGSESVKRINTRIITATHINLEKAIKENKFREDLYFRLNVIKINLPPLRERLDDIPLLLDYLNKKYSKKFNTSLKKYNDKLIDYLKSYSWPGNIREFQNIIERAVILSGNNENLDIEYFNLHENKGEDEFEKIFYRSLSLKEAQRLFEKNFLIKNLKKNCGSRKNTAKQLKIDRSYMSKLILKHKIKL